MSEAEACSVARYTVYNILCYMASLLTLLLWYGRGRCSGVCSDSVSWGEAGGVTSDVPTADDWLLSL